MIIDNKGFLKIFFAIILTIAVIAYGVVFGQRYFENQKKAENEVVISSFKECAEAGFSVLKTYPAQCKTDEGQLFVEDVGNAVAKKGLIDLYSPQPNHKISAPLKLEGRARGYWYFEGDFPIEVLHNGQVIGEGIGMAQGEWMTEDFVAFEAELYFNSPGSGTGLLILKRDNPSGLPENDDQLTVPIVFE
jgi:hypothetical protein